MNKSINHIINCVFFTFFNFVFIIPVVSAPSYIYVDQDNSYLAKKYSKNTSGDEFVMYLVSTYSPESSYILHKLKTIQGLSFMKDGKIPDYWFSFGKDKTGSLYSMQVIVHEGNHVVTSRPIKNPPANMESGKPASFYTFMSIYIDSGRSILVQRTDVFPSREIRNKLPVFITGNSKEKKVNGPGNNYYEIYIYPSNLNPSTQLFGIYGLLDEFTSYYHGKKAVFDMLEYYKKEAPYKSKEVRWTKFLQSMYSNYFGYYEFKIYILTYLQYAKENHPEMFTRIIENKAFIDAFLTVDSLHADLIKNFHKAENKIFDDLSAEDIEISRSEKDRIRIGKEYVFHDLSKIDNYLLILNKSEYKNMEELLKSKR